MAAVYAALAAMVGTYAAWNDLAVTRRATEAETASAARLLEERLNRILDASEHVTGRLAERVLAGGDHDLAVHQVSDLLEAAPYLANIVILDAQGRLSLQARGGAAARRDWSGVVWVRELTGAGAAPLVGAATLDEGSRAVAFPVARRVIGRSGQTLAFVAALVDVNSFKPFLHNLDDARAPAAGIFRTDGSVLVRQPWRGDDLAQAGAAGPALMERVAANAAGTYRAVSSYDGVARVFSYRALPSRGLVVWVGEGEAAALAEWRTRVWGIAALGVLSFVVLVGLSLLLLRQLTRERRASAELVTLNRNLERSNADLEQFAYIASHDLKEPLRNIASYVQLLQRRYHGKLDPDADAFIGYTVEGVRRLQAIINELLAYSRIGTGQLTLLPVQAGVLVSTALAHLKSVISEAQAVVEVKGPLPVVQADSAQLGSLFQNLIANALKYRRDDVRPEVVIGAEDRGQDWAFYVRDNGIGIDAQYHRQIFDLFKRLHPRDRYAGTGIGLAVCQRVVERHGGRIWVESTAGKGSTFWFTLPKRH